MTKEHQKKIRICHIATSHATIGNLFRGQHRFFSEHGFEVWGVSGPGIIADRAVQEENLKFYPIEIKRSMNLWGDLRFLLKLFFFLRRQEFDIVESSTAKAGFWGMIAAWLARVPVRVYTLRGAWYDSFKGIKRKIAALTVKVPCALAHRVFCISNELMEMDIKENVLNRSKAVVIAYGSSNGVDTRRFSRNEQTNSGRRQIRQSYNIPADAVVLGFIGRASIEKGVCELMEAFESLRARYGDKLYLLFVGGFDYMGGMLPASLLDIIRNHSQIRSVEMVDDVENYYAAIDILAMPSYREGFGNVNIEAAAMELPVVASNVCGCRESVWDGYSGMLVEPRNSKALYEGISKLIGDEEQRKRMGQEARKWIIEKFDSRMVWEALLKEYMNLWRQRVSK